MRSMKCLQCVAISGAIAVAAAGLAARSHADPIPPGWETNNMEPIGYSGLATPIMANVRAGRLLKIPAEPSPELRIPGAAAQTRAVSVAGIRLGSGESARGFKGIICDDISEFESYMPSHAVGLSQVRSPRNRHAQSGARLWDCGDAAGFSLGPTLPDRPTRLRGRE
jgi:hypothetical protein